MSKYSMRVAWSESDRMFVATCPELGDLSALGATQQKAAAELAKAVELALEVYEDEGRPAPDPRPVEEYSGQFRLRLPRRLHAWLADEAERQGVSLNALAMAILAEARGKQGVRTAASELRSAGAGVRISRGERAGDARGRYYGKARSRSAGRRARPSSRA